jgi:chromosome segregation ATPase
MSWLNATMHDPTVAPLVSEIARLQSELDRANESIDEKLEQLEDAGLGVVSLTRQLEDSKARVSSLEDEIARLVRKDDRRTRRMQKMRCLKCRTKVDFKDIDADER